MANVKCNWTILLILAFALWSHISKAQTMVKGATGTVSAADVKPGHVEIGPNDTNVSIIDTTLTGITQPALTYRYCIYPNPASEFVVVSGQEDTFFEIINMQGVRVALLHTNERFPLTNLASGVYWIRPATGTTSPQNRGLKLIRS